MGQHGGNYRNIAFLPKYRKNLSEVAIQKEDKILVFKTNYRLIQVKSIAESSKGSILQYI